VSRGQCGEEGQMCELKTLDQYQHLASTQRQARHPHNSWQITSSTSAAVNLVLCNFAGYFAHTGPAAACRSYLAVMGESSLTTGPAQHTVQSQK
jgi:hypothetical protein